MTITEQLAYSTVRIECELATGGICTGTGYFFKFKNNPEKREYIPVVITNKHVVRGAKKVSLFSALRKMECPLI